MSAGFAPTLLSGLGIELGTASEGARVGIYKGMSVWGHAFIIKTILYTADYEGFVPPDSRGPLPHPPSQPENSRHP